MSCTASSVMWVNEDIDIPCAGKLNATIELDRDGWLVIKPHDAVAALVLHQLAHGTLRAQWTYRGMTPSKGAPFGALSSIEIRGDQGPLLSDGGDPYYTGVSLSDEEQKACRAVVDGMRAKKRKSRPKNRRAS